MAKRPINYTSRDFESIKNDLVNYARRYYPSTYKDFSEASFGSLMTDMVAYVGDQLSFYTDYQANESFLESAIEYKNVVRLSKQLGFKIPGSARSTGMCAFYVLVPASTSGRGPDQRYIPTIQKGATLVSDGGATYSLNEDVDFSNTNNEITVARVDADSGVPTYFAVKAFGQIVSGESYVETVSVGNYQRFYKHKLKKKLISEIISVVDSQGNEYYEVPYLTQDVIYKEIPNYNSDKIAVPYKLRAVPSPRRFIVDHDTISNTYIQFGHGSADNITGNIIADPADVVLNVTGRNYITDETFDPTNLIQSDKLGVAPVNTTLTITYTANTSDSINATVGAIGTIVNSSLVFDDRTSLTSTVMNTVEASLEVENEEPILGDASLLSSEDIRQRAFASYSTQNRAVTRTDYITMAYRLPPKFGRIKRANVVRDKDSYKQNLNMYILSEDSDGNFAVPNQTLKQNLKAWLDGRRMINDTIDILDGKIINIGINFEVLADLDVNRYELLQRCSQEIQDKFLNVKGGIGEAVYLSDIYKLLNDVPGVTDTISIEFSNKVGGAYSQYSYNIDKNMSDDGRFLIIPSNAAAEVLLPSDDVRGVVK